MTKCEVEVLSNAVNAVVLRLPERRFPGIVIQGDSLKILADSAREVAMLSQDAGNQAIDEAIAEVVRTLDAYLRVYETALANENCELPYGRF